MSARNTIKQWFVTGAKPLQSQFWDWLDSFWHKDDALPISSISGLSQILESLPTSEEVSAYSGITQVVVGAGILTLPTNVILETLLITGAAQSFSIGTSTGGGDILSDVTEGSPLVIRIDRYIASGEAIHITCASTITLKFWYKQ
jgi:hypothetical protein